MHFKPGYKLFGESVLLKASVIHDLLEDVPESNEHELRNIDNQTNNVVDLVLEVTSKQKHGIRNEFFLSGITFAKFQS
jgi:hypothetical protein